jgi:hypothetical protein
MTDQPKLIVQVARGSRVDQQLSAQLPESVANGDVVVERGPADAEGHLEAPAAGQVVLSLPSPEALERQAGDVRRVLGQAGTGVEPLVVVFEAAEELGQADLAILVDAAGHATRPVIVRVIRDA